MWYQLRHVPMVQIPGALELKPHLHSDDDPWKKNYHFMYWKWPYSFNIGQNLPEKYHISVEVLRKVQISHALELMPLFNIDDDQWKKN